MLKRAALYVCFVVAGVAISLALGGCAPTQILKGSGEATPPPSGYIVECAKNAALENCK